MEASNGPSKNSLLLMFGLPILQTTIICASMYVGHVLTKRMDHRAAQATGSATSKPTVETAVPPVSISAPAASTPNSEVDAANAAPSLVPASTSAPLADHSRIPEPAVAAITKPAEKPSVLPASRVAEKPAATATRAASLANKTTNRSVVIPLSRPAPVPLPMMVPKKDSPKSVKIDADGAAKESRAVLKPATLDAPVVPVQIVAAPAAPTPVVETAAKLVPVVPAPTNAVAPQERAEVIAIPSTQAETNGDVAAAEPVHRAPVVAPKPVTPAPQPVQPTRTTNESASRSTQNEGRLILASAPVQPIAAPVSHPSLLLGRPVCENDLSVDLLYSLSAKFVDAYCVKKGMNPEEETKRWMKRWTENVDQAMDDGDSSEQQYINRVTIAKRDCFNIEKAPTDKVVEGCRILLRYRDGNFTWLSAMRDALTRENLRKTLIFLNAGPQI